MSINTLEYVLKQWHDFTVLTWEEQEILKKIEDFINNIENIDEIQIINTSSYFNENKEDINLILDYIYILIFNKTKDFSNKIKYIFAMEKVQKAKEKLSKSNNFDMTIDNMLIEIWREINEKNYRS